MRVTRVRTYELRCAVERPFANSHMWNRSRRASVVEVVTDAGLTGWGEGLSAPTAADLEAHVIGRDPFDAEAIGRELSRSGCPLTAVSAVDIALWDAMGKAVHRPIYQLLGGAVRRRVTAYASGLFLMDGAEPALGLDAEARGYVDAGFSAVKMKVGFGAAWDALRVEAVRRAIGGGVLLAVDANCAYGAGAAIAAGRSIAEHDIYWYEEPVGRHEVEAYCEIRRSLPMQIAGGEGLSQMAEFLDLVAPRAVDIVQPDISIAGGFTGCRKVQTLAEAYGVRVLPHMWGTAIRLAATLHWQAVIPDAPAPLRPEPSLLEFDMTENRLRTELAAEPIHQVDGSVAVPDGPGLGIEINRAALERYAVKVEEAQA